MKMPVALMALVCCSCSRIAGELTIMEGNFFYARGEPDRAIAAYMHSLEYPEALPYAEFGLGVVYLSMEEDAAALERFNASELNAPDDKQLLHRIRYNTGIIRFEQGDFEGAAADFRQSLELDGTSVGAKRNLELSLLSLARPRQREPAADPEHETSTRTVVLFEYLREKERDQWKSTEWTETTDQTEPDY